MNTGAGISLAAGTVPAGDSSAATIVGGAMLLAVGLALLVVSGGRLSRLGGIGLIVWGAFLVIPVAAGLA